MTTGRELLANAAFREAPSGESAHFQPPQLEGSKFKNEGWRLL